MPEERWKRQYHAASPLAGTVTSTFTLLSGAISWSMFSVGDVNVWVALPSFLSSSVTFWPGAALMKVGLK